MKNSNDSGTAQDSSQSAPIATETLNFTTAPSVDGHLRVNTEFSSSQLTQMVQWEVDAGRLTIEQANEMLTKDGAPSIKNPIDPNSPAAYIDSIMPPAEPKQFTMPETKYNDDPTGRDAQAVDKLARGWLSEGRFTREIGSFIAEEVSRTATRYEKMSEIERRGYLNEQESMLQKMWKGDTTRKLNLAKSLVDHLESKSPGLKILLENTGAANNAMIVAKFAMQAELLLERQRK